LADHGDASDDRHEAEVMLGARAVFSRGQRLALLAAFALIVMLRLPHAWVHGRFQDEEATVFLAYAWHFPWQDALFRSFAGYLNLGANATTLVAVQLVRTDILPLERAPYFTMIVALSFQLLPAVLLLTGRAEWLSNRLAVVASLLLIAVAPATEEVFFNVMHIQFHLALCVALILALDVPFRRTARLAYGMLLFFAPLCGPASIVLLPWFAIRGLIDRQRQRLMQLAFLAAGAAVQFLLFYHSSPLRGHVLDPGTVAAAMFVRLLALPLLGIDFAYEVAEVIYNSQIESGTAWWWFTAIAAAVFTALIAVAVQRRDAAIWLILSSLSIAAATLGFGMVIVRPIDPFAILGSERYNFLPMVLLGMGMVALATRSGFRGRILFSVLCAMPLLTGAYYYSKPLVTFANGPSWPDEVDAWRSDHDRPLAVWPSPWTADLSDTTRSCSPPGGKIGPSSDPRYCESGWISGFYRPN
jgi:hypothetical protein